jgi:HAD superfamily hydrolase (TIGR01549 family)
MSSEQIWLAAPRSPAADQAIPVALAKPGKYPRVILFDLWKTLVTSHCREPVWSLQQILGHQVYRSASGQEVLEADDEFLRYCLTTNVPDAEEFLHKAAVTFGCGVREGALEKFEKVLKGESSCTAIFGDVEQVLRKLRARGFRLGVVSNLWPFPVGHIFGTIGLGGYFEHCSYSFAVGTRKPEPQIFLEACRKFGVDPHECLMVGDNLEADVKGALRVGMSAALIDRPHEISPLAVVKLPGVLHLSSLTELLTVLR